jgi:hypothetical protein
MDKTFEILLGEYRDRMAMLSEALTRGNCGTFEEYKYICGQLRGLEVVAKGDAPGLDRMLPTKAR